MANKSRLAKSVIVFCILFLNTTLTYANACNSSFNDLMREGLESHPSINVSKKIMKGADLQVSSALWGYFPTPSIDLSKSSSNTRINLRIDQPIWDGGKIDAVRDKARAWKNEATHIYAKSQYQLIEDYLQTLEKYLQAQDKISILNGAVNQLNAIMQTVDRMIDAGELSVADKNLLSTKIADIYSILEITKAEFDAARIQFEILTGRKIICNVSFKQKSAFGTSLNVATLVDDALNYSPSLKIINARIEAAQSDVDAAESKLWPTLKLRGEHRNGALYESDVDKSENLIYFVFEMSTGAGASALSNIGRSEINVLKVKNEKLSKEKEVIDRLMNNYTRFVAVKNNLEILSNDVLVAEKVFQSNERLFFLDQKKWVDVVNALTALNNKKISKAQLYTEFRILELKLALKTNRLSLETGGFLSEVLQ